MFSNIKKWLSRNNVDSTSKYKLSICCIQKDENEYLLEWIDYHMKVGVEHFYINNNNSEIPPNDILQTYINKGIVTLNDFPGLAQQEIAYNYCLKKYGKDSKWMAFIDIDEYIVPKSTNGDLVKFLKDYENYGGIGVNWLVYGSSGHMTRTGASVIDRFLRRSEEFEKVNVHIKSIVQPEFVKNCPNPHFFEFSNNMFNVNENFERIDGPFSPHSSQKIQINHYHCKSEEEYHDKIKRGCADGVPDTYKMQNFYGFDSFSNKVYDDSAAQIFNTRTKKLR